MSDTKTIDLASPIQAHGQTTSTLNFRKPTGKDLRVNGLPFTFTGKGDTKVDTANLSKMISALANIPISSVDQLSAPDYSRCMTEVLGFFNASDQPNSTTDTMNSPDTGETMQEYST